MLDIISSETWNKAGVAAIKIHENENVNKTVLLLLCISDSNKQIKKSKGNMGLKK